MSPVNSDESSGEEFSDSGRQLTRKEIRAREKSLTTEGNDVVPPQAFETGPSPQVPPAMPAEPPTVQQDALHHDAVQHDAVQHHTPLAHEELRQDEPAHHYVPPHQEEPVHQEDSAEGDPHAGPDAHDPHAELHGVAGQPDFAADHTYAADHAYAGHPDVAHPDDAGHPAYVDHPDYAVHHEDEAHHVYEDAGVYAAEHHSEQHFDEPDHPLMAGAGSVAAAPAKSKKVRRRRRWFALLLTLGVFVTALVVGAQFLKPLLGGDTIADYPGPGTGEVNVSVEPGEGTRSVATKLEDQKVVANADTFLRELTASGGTIAPGDFQFRQEMKNSDAVAVLLGQGEGKVMYFALSAGLRIGESLQAISQGSGIPVAELQALSDSPAQFGLPEKAKNLEGYLAPGEHRFPVGTPAKEILQNLVTTTVDELKAQGVTDPAKQYDVVTVASIVQAEGGQAEYGDVAGAIYNRLKPNNTETAGLIQSDATVTYGLGIKSFHIDEDQKADKSNPYNTYANQGLPVGPIGSPGKNAIDAAAKPKANEYMYWVTINLDTKETKFSKTLAEHNVYVEQYNAWCAANAGRCT
ncbi:endolytic transglycosylase MltG [Arthrobacter sp. B10-11]|uniref:endolytic transglycosylase MltG n=1 Tax=Arthrobacter sp. B10-11 TaxID=3081160 RepID=UPI0029531124|nr:endolytic transglycosylase MltG [Arthrobacter sp. B10-11]MDV8148365.1 endolytic transglycosylase MltG [Arthrobacter sp. B10-11]